MRIHAGQSTLAQQVQVDRPRSRPPLIDHVRPTLVRRYKSQPPDRHQGRTLNTQLSLILFNSNLTFGGVESKNLHPDLSLCAGARRRRSSPLAKREDRTREMKLEPNPTRCSLPDPSICISNLAHSGLDRVVLIPRPRHKCSPTFWR